MMYVPSLTLDGCFYTHLLKEHIFSVLIENLFVFFSFFLGGITSQSRSGVQHTQNAMRRLEDFQRTHTEDGLEF